MDKGIIGIVVMTIVVLGVIFGIAKVDSKKQASILPRDRCVQHSGIAMHIHPQVVLFNGTTPLPIPANIGITAACMKAIHTHDDSGELHVEYPTEHEFILGDFFANWGVTFSKDQIFDFKADDTHTITVTVDGKDSTEFEKLVLRDNQQIIIRYGDKK